MYRPKTCNQAQLSLFQPALLSDCSPAPGVLSKPARQPERMNCFLQWSSPDTTKLAWLHLAGQRYPCHIYRRRGRMNVRLDGGRVVVGCGSRTSNTELSSFIHHSRRWLVEQINASADFNPPIDDFGRIQMMMGGQLRSVMLVPQSLAPAQQRNTDILSHEDALCLPQTNARQTSQDLLARLHARTEQNINTVLASYARLLGVEYNRVRVAHYKAQWGCCRLDKRGGYNLSFNARLAMMPDRVWHYVLLHELCHCRIFDHSARFWALLDKYYSKIFYNTSQEPRQWLSRYDALLRIDLEYLVAQLYQRAQPEPISPLPAVH